MYQDYRKMKFVIEVWTSRNKWQRARLLGIKNGVFIIELKSGDIIKRRSIKNIKFDKVKRIKSLTKDPMPKGKLKQYKVKKHKKTKKEKLREKLKRKGGKK
jgi:hypothetical protein